MTTCTITPTVATPLGTRVFEALQRYFGTSVITRESVDQAWIDSGLGRLGSDTLLDIGAPPGVVEHMSAREAWKLAAALDATRHL
jgi:hypothetical protein